MLTAVPARAQVADSTVVANFDAVQAALDAATDVNNDGRITVHVGTGTVTGNLTITRNNVLLRGSGQTLTTFQSVGVDELIPGIGVGGLTGVSGVRIENLHVRGTGPAGGIAILNSTNCTVSNVMAENGHDGIAMGDSTNCLVTASLLIANSADGVRIIGGSLNSVTNSTVESNVTNGIRIKNATNTTVSGVTARLNLGEGLFTRQTNGTKFLNNTVTGNLGNGLFMRQSSNSLVSGNTITGNVGFGVFRRTVVNDDFNANAGGVQAPPGNNTISGNTAGQVQTQ